MSCADVSAEAVLAPLGMDASLGLTEADAARTARVWQAGALRRGRAVQLRAVPPRRAAAGRRLRERARLRRVPLLPARGRRRRGGRALLARETVEEMLAPQFGPLPGGVGGVGEWPDLCWGLGFDVRGRREPHWSGTTLSARAASHFGASGTLAWLDPERGVGLVALANRGTYSRLVARAVGRSRRCGDRSGRSGVDPAMKRIRTRPGSGARGLRRSSSRRISATFIAISSTSPATARWPRISRPTRSSGPGRGAIASTRAARARAAGCSAIARSCALDHLRAERRRGARERLAAQREPERAAADAAGLCDGYSAALEAGLGRLSAADREVIALRVLLELDAGEAARLLEITPTACTTRLSRALARLAAEVEAHEHV